MEEHIINNSRCIADVVFRVVGKSINFGKVIIDTETYNVEGKLTLDTLKGFFTNDSSYVFEYIPYNKGEDWAQLHVNFKKTGNPIEDFSQKNFIWESEENIFPNIKLVFKNVYYE